MNKRSVYIIILGAALLFTLFEEIKLRPYLLKHHIDTFYMADSLPNFLAVVIPFFGYVVLRYPISVKTAGDITLRFVGATVLYEICQLWMPQRTFDLKDIAASVLGGVFSYLVFRLVNSSPKITTADQH